MATWQSTAEKISQATSERLVEICRGESAFQPATPSEVESALRVRAYKTVESSHKTEVDIPYVLSPAKVSRFTIRNANYVVAGRYKYKNIYGTWIKARFRVEFKVDGNSRIALKGAAIVGLLLDGVRIY